MFQVLSTIHWLSVLAAFVAYYFLGALWFAAFFSKPYRMALGKENEAPAAMSPLFFVGPALCTPVVTMTGAVLMQQLRINTYGRAVEFALLVGLGYLVANTVNIAINPNINPNMPRPLFYGLISGGYHLIGILLACLIMVVLH